MHFSWLLMVASAPSGLWIRKEVSASFFHSDGGLPKWVKVKSAAKLSNKALVGTLL